MVGRLAYIVLAFLLVGCGEKRVSAVPRPSVPVVFEIEGAPEDEAILNSMLGQLREEFRGVDVPPGPFGRTSDRYNHHIFWDSDVWMFPALCFFEPEMARVIPEFRIRTMQAEGVPFFWETKPDGSDGTPPSSRLHRSAPGSVSWMMGRASELGLARAEDADRVRRRVRDYYASISLKGVRSIDEYAEKVDDELYANLVANLASGSEVYPLARDSRSFLNWKGDEARTYQQAAGALLAVWPLEHPMAEPKVIADRFGPKINRHGPAMSEPLLAIAYCRAAEPDRAYEHWRKGWADFTSGSKFHEYRSDLKKPSAGYFLTGAAGEVNAVLYGFLGLRIQVQKDPLAKWSMPLKNGRWLNARPQLPRKWKRLTVRGFRVLDQTLTLVAERDTLRVEPSR